LRYGHEDGIVGIGGVTTSAGRDGSDGTKTVCRRGWVDVGKRLAVEDSIVLACRITISWYVDHFTYCVTHRLGVMLVWNDGDKDEENKEENANESMDVNGVLAACITKHY
jgi:hypothetical protein